MDVMRRAMRICGPLLLSAMLALAPSARAEWLPATVRLSDGTSLRGEVYIPNNRIIIQNEAQGRRYTVRTAEIARLENTIETQSLEEKWIFKESGLDDKIFLGQYYPVRHYLTRVTFHDGKALEGHMIAATLYVRNDDGQQRFILRAKAEGKVGQKLEDLRYVRAIDFGTEGAGARGTIAGTLKLPPGERLRKVLALNRDKLFTVEGKFSPADGMFRVSDCTEGVYDLIVVTDKAIHLAFSIEREPKAQRLDAEAVKEVQDWVNKLRDFFHSQTIVYAAGNTKRTFALMWLERRGGTTLHGAERLHRYDVWVMHKPVDQWLIEKRLYVWRNISSDVDLKPLRVVVNPALGGHAVSAQAPNVELRIELRPQGQAPIPPHQPQKEQADGNAGPGA